MIDVARSNILLYKAPFYVYTVQSSMCIHEPEKFTAKESPYESETDHAMLFTYKMFLKYFEHAAL